MPKGVYSHKPQQGFQKGHRINEGEKHWYWKGDNVSYRNLHRWVVDRLGLAQKCEYCGKEKTTVKSIHWANKSHKYFRKLNDWIALCAKCHKKYDGNYKKLTKKHVCNI